VREGDWVHALWESDGVVARVARAALAPAELTFAVVAAARASLYSSGVLASRPTVIPALSVGNLTVGGTGKTPLAAHFAARLREAGARPAIVLRGYGEDEPLVHRVLNPDVPVVISPDRLAGAEQASQHGCDVVVLDDAFQHRRAQRVADVVVVSADAWRSGPRRLLPAGPWRERLGAARRASLAVVTRKAASLERAEAVADVVVRAGRIPTAIVHLDAGTLREVAGAAVAPLEELRGASVLVIAGVGDPRAFAAQVASRGANVATAVFADHYRYGTDDARALAEKAARFDRIVCTLKDAVKLGPLWPGPMPLWYVSQRVVVERGADAMDAVLTTTLRARSDSIPTSTAGLARTT